MRSDIEVRVYLTNALEMPDEEKEMSLEKLAEIVNNLPSSDGGYFVCELVEVDTNYDLHFEISHYSIYG